MTFRHSEIRREKTHDGEVYVVDLWEDGKLVQTRRLDGKSFYYAEDVSKNWDNGLIQQLNG